MVLLGQLALLLARAHTEASVVLAIVGFFGERGALAWVELALDDGARALWATPGSAAPEPRRPFARSVAPAGGKPAVLHVRAESKHAELSERRQYTETVLEAVATGVVSADAAGVVTTPVAAINANGTAVITWVQNDGTVNSIYASRYTGGAWQAAELLESGASAASAPTVAIDNQSNITALWVQSDGSANSIYLSRYNNDARTYFTVLPFQ